MSKVTLPQRYELKFLVPQEQFYHLKIFPYLQKETFKKMYPDRFVHTLYFDNADYRNINQSLDGQGDRQKVRLRWYNNDTTQIQLEIKIKQENNLSHKEIYKINNNTKDQYNSHTNFNEEAQLILRKFPIPTIENKYQRSYFATTDNEIRLTIDHQNYSKNHIIEHKQNSPTKFLHEPAIIELKFSDHQLNRVKKICQNWPYRQTSYSKYTSHFLDLI